MDGMVGLPGCRRILVVVATSIVAVLAAMAVSLSILMAVPAGMQTADFAVALAALVLPIPVLATVYASLSALSESIELVMSIKAKRRLQTKVLPALRIGAGLATSGVVVALVAYAAAAFDIAGAVRWLLLGLESAAFAIPLAGLAFLGAAGAKRYHAMIGGSRVMRRSIDAMAARLGQAGAADDDGLARIRASFETEHGTASTSVRPNPQGFTLAGLTSKPFHDPAAFAWMRAFERNVDAIRAEAEAVLQLHRERVDIYNYPGLDGDQWKAFKLVARHKPREDNLALCPTTASLLKTIPGYPVFRDAMFSILEPGGEITRHRDVANIFLTAHFGLITPEAEDGFIEVAGIAQPWKEGEFVVFDSSYEHRAVNRSRTPRVVLLIDFLHPEITGSERAWIQEVGL